MIDVAAKTPLAFLIVSQMTIAYGALTMVFIVSAERESLRTH
jgi:hypothetical protein